MDKLTDDEILQGLIDAYENERNPDRVRRRLLRAALGLARRLGWR